MGATTRQASESTTRQKLLEAGARLFGLHGFEGTTTRALAEAAGVNLGAILYHFRGKEGLYRAVLEQCVANKRQEVAPCLERVRSVCADPEAGRGALTLALHDLVATIVAVMLGNPDSQPFSQIMMQEQIAPTAAYDILYQGFFQNVFGTWLALLSRLTGLPPESTELKLRTLSVLGQFVIFRVGMTTTLRFLDGEALTPGYLDCIVRFGIQQCEAIVEKFAPTCGEVS